MGMSALKVSGRKADISGLTSRIHLPETSVSWRALPSLCSISFLRVESPTCITPFGSPSISESSSRDIERPAPKRMASRIVASAGSDIGSLH